MFELLAVGLFLLAAGFALGFVAGAASRQAPRGLTALEPPPRPLAEAFDACALAADAAMKDALKDALGRVFITLDGKPVSDSMRAARWARVGCYGCGILEVVRGSFRHADTCPDWPGLAVPIEEVLRQARPVPEPPANDPPAFAAPSWPGWPL